jgi:hypothetical protein
MRGNKAIGTTIANINLNDLLNTVKGKLLTDFSGISITVSESNFTLVVTII